MHGGIRSQESPPKGLVQKRCEQFNHTSSNDQPRPHRSRSVPISTVVLNAQQPQQRYMETCESPTRKVQIDRVRYDLRAPANLLRKNPDDPIGDECGETTTTTERLSDGERRLVRVIREVGAEKDRRLSQPISRSTARMASHSAPRGYPVVTVSVRDPQTWRKRSISELSQQQSAVIHIRDDSSHSTTIPITRSSPTTSHRPSSPVKNSRPSSRRAVQVEQFDSKSITVPPPSSNLRSAAGNESNSSAPMLWSPLSVAAGERHEVDMENELLVRDRELFIARQTIRRLSMDLARVERDKQQLEIEAILQRQKSEAELASRMADAITQLRSSSTEPETRPSTEKRRTPTLKKFDPAAIKQECERMMEALCRDRGDEDELADASEVDREIERLKHEVNAKQDSVMRTEQQQQSIIKIISVQDQVVMYNGVGGTGDSRTTLINKLERELTDAQLCNLRLNAKIGTLVSNGNATIKKEVLDLKVSLTFMFLFSFFFYPQRYLVRASVNQSL
ncbi:hypothetical protein Q1695_003302 [Nippostrongylus brasiliensis]|nr:hypothetical protein Q1695_003302 [Nippostrongylus brasiliensis]